MNFPLIQFPEKHFSITFHGPENYTHKIEYAIGVDINREIAWLQIDDQKFELYLGCFPGYVNHNLCTAVLFACKLHDPVWIQKLRVKRKSGEVSALDLSKRKVKQWKILNP